MNVHFQRATLLLKQHRREQAEEELRLALGEDPNFAPAHALLAMCLSEAENHADATRKAQAAIGLAPEMPFGHYALACVLLNRNRFDEAEGAIAAAIGLDPSDADYYALLANARMQQKNWAGALEAADQGLAQDPESVDCVNRRAAALVKLGRKGEAEATIQGVLARDPEDAGSHATLGWTLLERRQPRQALEHFREALRLNPGVEFARAGMVEALKSRYPVYGLVLRYFLWMGKLSGRAQWGVILGGYFGMRALRQLQRSSPAIAAWTWPISVAYLVFVLLTWLADPLFNLLLRLNRFGRYALSRQQRIASNWIGGCLGLAIVLLCVAMLTDSAQWFLLAAVAGFITLPLSAVFHCSAGWPRLAMAGYTGMVALVGVVGARAAAARANLAPKPTPLSWSAFLPLASWPTD